MTIECDVCLLPIELDLENKPTLHQIETLIAGIETTGDLLQCGKSRVKCEPLKKLQQYKRKTERELTNP